MNTPQSRIVNPDNACVGIAQVCGITRSDNFRTDGTVSNPCIWTDRSEWDTIGARSAHSCTSNSTRVHVNQQTDRRTVVQLLRPCP